MPFNGSGVFTRAMNWVSDATAGIKIRADRHDTEDNGFASGLSNTICRDGQSIITANIPLNNNRITGLADPTAAQDAVTRNWVDTNVVGGALIGDTPPAGAKVGNLFWESDTGNLFLRYDDGTSVQWVQVNVASPTGGQLALAELAVAPSTPADIGALYSKDASGATELFYRRESSGAETQITKSGRVPITSAAAVNAAGAASRDIPIPADVDVVTLAFQSLQSNAICYHYIQMIGSVTPTYNGVFTTTTNAVSTTLWTTNAQFTGSLAANTIVTGNIVLRRVSNNVWQADSKVVFHNSGINISAGYISFATVPALTAIRIGVVGGTYTAGAVRAFFQ